MDSAQCVWRIIVDSRNSRAVGLILFKTRRQWHSFFPECMKYINILSLMLIVHTLDTNAPPKSLALSLISEPDLIIRLSTKTFTLEPIVQLAGVFCLFTTLPAASPASSASALRFSLLSPFELGPGDPVSAFFLCLTNPDRSFAPFEASSILAFNACGLSPSISPRMPPSGLLSSAAPAGPNAVFADTGGFFRSSS